MTITEGSRKWNILQEISSEEGERIVAAEPLGDVSGDIRLLWLVSDQAMSLKLVRLLAAGGEDSPCRIFMSGPLTCFSFPYEEQRPLSRFYFKSVLPFEEKARIIRAFAVLCMTSALPAGLIYEILKQGQVMLHADNSLSFNYVLRLHPRFGEHEEAETVQMCAEVILDMLDTKDPADVLARALISKRYARDGYRTWVTLYRDVQAVTEPKERKKVKARVIGGFESRKDRIVRALLFLALILTSLALLLLLSQIITGEIPFFNIFTRSFTKIGTESLLQ